MNKEDETTQIANKMLMSLLNKKVNHLLTPSRSVKHYLAGRIDNKRCVLFTKQRIKYENRIGFFSWLETEYKNNKIKRTLIAKSGSKRKAEARANRLLNKFSVIHEVKNE